MMSACETSFEPFQEGDLVFSMYGYLDGGEADTQFVAVTPVRDTLFASADPIDAVVTSENLDTGERSTWRDSVFTFANGLAGHVFWTTMPIRPTERYRLTVTRSDGATSHATVTIPDTLGSLLLQDNITRSNPIPRFQRITASGAANLAELKIIYTLVFPQDGRVEVAEFTYLADLRQTNDQFSATVDTYGDVLTRFGERSCPHAEKVEVFVATAGEAWPPFFRLDPETRALPTVGRNVEDGLGFVGGIVSRTDEWEILRALFLVKQQQCLSSG